MGKRCIVQFSHRILWVYYFDFLVEQSFQKEKEKERTERSKIVFNRIKNPLSEFLRLLWQIFKASSNRPEEFPNSYTFLFTDDYYQNIRYLDFSQEAPVVPRRTWFQFISGRSAEIKNQFEASIDAYGYILDNDTLTLIESVCQSGILNYFMQIQAVPQVDQEHGFKREYLMLNGPHEIIREGVPSILKLLEQVNEVLETPIEIHPDFHRDDVSPRWGVNRTRVEI